MYLKSDQIVWQIFDEKKNMEKCFTKFLKTLFQVFMVYHWFGHCYTKCSYRTEICDEKKWLCFSFGKEKWPLIVNYSYYVIIYFSWAVMMKVTKLSEWQTLYVHYNVEKKHLKRRY